MCVQANGQLSYYRLTSWIMFCTVACLDCFPVLDPLPASSTTNFSALFLFAGIQPLPVLTTNCLIKTSALAITALGLVLLRDQCVHRLKSFTEICVHRLRSFTEISVHR